MRARSAVRQVSEHLLLDSLAGLRQACRVLLLTLPQGAQLGGGLGQLKLRQRRRGVGQRLAGCCRR
jgi:hypothetical protein